MTPPVFPAATVPEDASTHPAACACTPCVDDVVGRLARPLVEPRPAVDRALIGGRR